jgi:glyoxylase-like metal-dependent hydrolase (beta-lactamase superfamily II)
MTVSERRLGDVRAAVLSAGELHYTPPFEPGLEWITDDTVIDADGLAAIGVNALYAEVGDARILIDPSTFGPDETLPRARLVAHAGIAAALTALGVTPEAITHVLITHLHGDHLNALTVAGDPRFPAALHFIPELDWRAHLAGELVDDEVPGFLEPIAAAGLLRRVGPGHVISDRVRFIHTGGESPGHQIVEIDTSAGPLRYLGDLVHFPAEVAHFDWLGVRGRNRDELIAGRERALGSPAGVTFVFTHGAFPAWGVVERDGRWRYLDTLRSRTPRR